MTTSTSSPGMVSLIGAGPGDPGLITVKGLRALQAADVIIYDYLVDQTLVRAGRADAEYIYVGKKAGQHTLEQDEINALLVRYGQAGKTVARLKGGDPYVFGRGGEEAEVLSAAGIPWEVVPGITSAIAAPAYAGVPVTQRGMTSAFSVITGHEDPTKGASDIDWEAFGRGTGTLVFLMGVGNLDAITAQLTAHGRPATTPVAVVRWGTTARQQVVTGTLADIADRVRAAKLTAPAVTIVGEVAALRDRLAWFDRRPLWGKRIVITRATDQAPELAERLEALGAQTVTLSTIQIQPAAPEPLYAAIDRLASSAYDWVILTSVNGVAALAQRLDECECDWRTVRANIAAIGPATAQALRERGVRPDFIPTEYVAEAIAAEIGEVAGQRILLPRADIARPALAELLRGKGATVDEVAAYRTVTPPLDPERVCAALTDPRPDIITFTSSSTVRGLAEALSGQTITDALRDIAIACIGPVTAQTARDIGLEPDIVAGEYTMEGLTEAIRAWFAMRLAALSAH